MKPIWTGTDVLMLNDISQRKPSKKPYWYAYRIFMRIFDKYFAESHFTNCQLLKRELEEFGMTKPIEILLTPLKYNKPFPKVKHDGFNVLWYNSPRKDRSFNRWLYGLDLIERLIAEFPEVNFIMVDQSFDMQNIYPIVDFMVRPNRHDGFSRMVRECIIQEIPYYWSQEKPCYEIMKRQLQYLLNEKDGLFNRAV